MRGPADRPRLERDEIPRLEMNRGAELCRRDHLPELDPDILPGIHRDSVLGNPPGQIAERCRALRTLPRELNLAAPS